MSFSVALNFEDGVTRFIDCRPAETVVDAAYRHGINIPMDCREGACATCKCRVESGQYTLGEYIDEALSKEEAGAGYALACQMHPQSDCVVLVPTQSEACNSTPQNYVAQIEEIKRLEVSPAGAYVRGAIAALSPLRQRRGRHVRQEDHVEFCVVVQFLRQLRQPRGRLEGFGHRVLLAHL